MLVYCWSIVGANVGSMLAHRRRRWANLNPTLAQRLVFAGLLLSCVCLELLTWPFQNLTSLDVIFWRLKTIPTLKEHRYSNEAGRSNSYIYDEKTVWCPWFIQTYFSVVRLKGVHCILLSQPFILSWALMNERCMMTVSMCYQSWEVPFYLVGSVLIVEMYIQITKSKCENGQECDPLRLWWFCDRTARCRYV